MKRAANWRTLTILLFVALLLVGSKSWAGGGTIVVFDDPTYPFQAFTWEDDQGSGLTVVMSLRDGSGPTLGDAVEIFLPETATNFTPDFAFPIPDTINYRGNHVPVFVYEAPSEVILWAYSNYQAGGEELLTQYLVASGLVKGRWSGKNFKAMTFSAIGPVSLLAGGEAILVAFGHEVFKEGPDSAPQYRLSVRLH